MGNVFPLFIGLLASLLIALSYLVFDLSYLILFVAFLISHYMLKNLDEIKTMHFYLAAAYSVICFVATAYLRIFALNYFTFAMNFTAAFNITIREIIFSLDIFQWLILIVMPIISYRYLKMKA